MTWHTLGLYAQSMQRTKPAITRAAKGSETESLLERCHLELPPKRFARFLAMLDRPASKNLRLAKLLKNSSAVDK